VAGKGQSPLVPRLRFPEFQQSPPWTEEKLDLLASTLPPPAKLPSSLYQRAGRFPIIDQSQDFICGWTDDSTAVITAPLPCVVFGDHTCTLKFMAQPFAQGADGIKILSAKPAIKIDFLFHALCLVPLVAKDYKRHFATLRERKVFFPDIKSGEQQKIANCLTSLDEVIAAQGRKVEALKKYKRGLMQQLFPREGETVPRLRFSASCCMQDWSPGKVSDLVNVLQGYGFAERLQGNRYGKFPFYKVSDISRWVDAGKTFLGEAKNHIDDDVVEELRAKLIPPGTTVFAKIGEAIRSNKRAITTRLCLVDNNAAGVKAIAGVADDVFIYYLWCQIPLIRYAGGVVPAVNKLTIEEIPVCYPTLEEQQRVASTLLTLDLELAGEAERLALLRIHKKGLMQQLFPSPQAVHA
jgi:type I restriction enzyme, S subunit